MSANRETKETVKADIAKIMSVLGNELSDTIDTLIEQARSESYLEAQKELKNAVGAIRANLHNPKTSDKPFRTLMSNMLYRLEGSVEPEKHRLHLAVS